MNIPASKGLWLPCALALLTCSQGLAFGPESPSPMDLAPANGPVSASPDLGGHLAGSFGVPTPQLQQAGPFDGTAMPGLALPTALASMELPAFLGPGDAALSTTRSGSHHPQGRSLFQPGSVWPILPESLGGHPDLTASGDLPLQASPGASLEDLTRGIWSVRLASSMTPPHAMELGAFLLDDAPSALGELPDFSGDPVLNTMAAQSLVDLTHETGFAVHQAHHLQTHLELATGRTLGPLQLTNLARLGTWTACAAYAPRAGALGLHFLVLLELGGPMRRGANPLRQHWLVPAEAEALQALPNGTLLAILADGTYRVFGRDGQTTARGVWHPEAVKTQAQAPQIRQVAGAPDGTPLIAMGGDEGLLKVYDLQRPAPEAASVASIAVGGVIGSITWTLQDSGQVLAATLDEGRLLLFDLRAGMEPAHEFDAARPAELLCHSFLGPAQVVLGYRDAALSWLDLRHPDPPLETWTDPHVTAAGQLDTHPQGDRMVVSGIAGFSVYALSSAGLKLCFHARPCRIDGQALFWDARFGPEDRQLWTVDTLGRASVYLAPPQS